MSDTNPTHRQPIFNDFDPFEDPFLADERWELIHCGPQADAIEAGVLVPYSLVHNGQSHPVTITRELYLAYQPYPTCLQRIIRNGLMRLRKTDSQSPSPRKWSVVVKNQVWVIQDSEGIIFLRPQDC